MLKKHDFQLFLTFELETEYLKLLILKDPSEGQAQEQVAA